MSIAFYNFVPIDIFYFILIIISVNQIQKIAVGLEYPLFILLEEQIKKNIALLLTEESGWVSETKICKLYMVRTNLIVHKLYSLMITLVKILYWLYCRKNLAQHLFILDDGVFAE